MSTIVSPRLEWASSGAPMTPEEFDATSDCDERFRYELVHGVLVVTPPPSEAHRDPNEELGFLLRKYREQHPSGAALDKTLPEQYVRTSDSRRIADRVIWTGLGRLPDPARDVPSIVVEFVSPGKRSLRRDYDQKQQEYLALGVQEYWVIDRFQRTMTVFRQSAGPQQHVVTETETYESPLLPGFQLPLGRLLALADAWSRREEP